MTDETKPPAWLRPVADFGPLVLFFVTFKLYGLMAATAVILVASLLALAVIWSVERRVPVMPLVTAGVIAVFGGLTLWLQEELFIKMKPTIVQAIFAAVLLGGLAFGRPLLKPLLGKTMPLTDAGWHGLTLRYGLFFVIMAVLNEIVWRTQTTDMWVNFKFYGITALTFAFILSQMPFINRHMEAEVEASASDDLDGAARDSRESP